MVDMAGGTSGFPAILDTFTSQVNTPTVGKTKTNADHVNGISAGIIAAQTELGVNVAGSKADLVTRLAVGMNDDGTAKLAIPDVKTGAYTALWGDLVRVDTSGGDVTITLTTAVGNSGSVLHIKHIISGGTLTIDGAGSETIQIFGAGATTQTSTSQGDSFMLASDGSNILAL